MRLMENDGRIRLPCRFKLRRRAIEGLDAEVELLHCIHKVFPQDGRPCTILDIGWEECAHGFVGSFR